MELNALTHMAMSKKIESMRPKQLYRTCIELAEDLYSNGSNSTIYSLACVAKAEARLTKISKLNLPQQTKTYLHNALGRVTTYSDCTITDSDLLESIFTITNDRFSIYLYNLEQMVQMNQFLAKLTKHITGMDLYLKPASLDAIYGDKRNSIVQLALVKLIPANSPIFNYIAVTKPTLEELDKVPINDMKLIIESINELKELHAIPTTN